MVKYSVLDLSLNEYAKRHIFNQDPVIAAGFSFWRQVPGTLMIIKTSRFIRYAMLILLGSAFMGCGGGSEFPLAEVSGKITNKGEPVPNVVVMFFPKSTKETFNAGPYSIGETGQDGVYTLKTRYDRAGAVVGLHRVELAYADVDPELEASRLEQLESGEGESGGVATPHHPVDIPKKWGLDSKMELSVPAEGTKTLNIEFDE